MSEWKKSKTQETASVGEEAEKKETSCTLVGDVNWYNHCVNALSKVEDWGDLYHKHFICYFKNIIRISY